MNRIRLGGLICTLKIFLQLNMCQELQFSVFVYRYWGVIICVCIYIYIYIYIYLCVIYMYSGVVTIIIIIIIIISCVRVTCAVKPTR